jgi:hypothetical protein
MKGKTDKFKKYFDDHIDILKHSFNIDRTFIKLMCIDIGFLVTLVLSYGIVYIVWTKNLVSIASIYNILNTALSPEIIPTAEVIRLWNHFVITAILVMIAVVILYAIILSIYSAIGHSIMTKNRFSIRLLLNYFYIYIFLTLIYILFSAPVFFFSNNTIFIAYCILIFTFIYLYLMLVFYIVTTSEGLLKVLKSGFKKSMHVQNIFPAIIFAIILITVLFTIIHLIFGGIIALSVFLALFSMLYVSVWMKKYLYKSIMIIDQRRF